MVSNEGDRAERATLEAMVRANCPDRDVGVGNYDSDRFGYWVVRRSGEAQAERLTLIPDLWIRGDEADKIVERVRDACNPSA